MNPIKTSGDRLAHVALGDFGGKALFVKEIEEALLDGRVDVGVHSLKDMPAVLPTGLDAGRLLRPRGPARRPRARAAAAASTTSAAAPSSARSSLRRRALVLARRPDLRVEPIRGNVETRLAKLASGVYDAIIVARAGLVRLGIAPDARRFPSRRRVPPRRRAGRASASRRAPTTGRPWSS